MSTMLYRAHSWARIWFAGAMLALVLMQRSMAEGLVLLLLLTVLLRLLQGDFKRIQRLTGLLQWFLPPIFLLHLFFTPGALIFPAFIVSMTYEGLHRGVWICVHFTDLFLAAMLFGSALKQAEWLRLFALFPGFRQRGAGYILMLPMMQRSVSQVLTQVDRQWRLRRNWMAVPTMLISAMRQAIAVARLQAHALWLRWPDRGGNARVPNMDFAQHAIPSAMAMDVMFTVIGSIALAWSFQ
ncbi:MAG: hypothetical protein R8L58_04550 [Mariprofundaceae bacterium]